MATMQVAVGGGGGTHLFERLLDAKVQVFHGSPDDTGTTRLIPNIQFYVRLPMDELDILTKWALAPIGESRFAKVEMTVFDRGRTLSRKWTITKAYIHHYHEVEFPKEAHNQTLQENIIELVVRGLLEKHEDYSGQNVAVMGDKKDEPQAEQKPKEAQKQAAPAQDDKKKTWIEISLVDDQGYPVPGEKYKVRLPDGSIKEGTLDGDGRARIDGIEEGKAEVSFPDRGIDWKKA